MVKDITLSNGIKMPALVQTTNWQNYEQMTALVTEGLKVGFRAFDTARDYGNEPIVGRVMTECLKAARLKREDVFITTKIGNSQQAKGDIAGEIEKSLENLQTDYVDLWLMHWPYPGYYINTWRKMEKVYATGKVRAIGMANYHVRHFKTLFAAGIDIVPHCVQFEHHPMRTADDIFEFCRAHNIAVQAYSPILSHDSEDQGVTDFEEHSRAHWQVHTAGHPPLALSAPKRPGFQDDEAASSEGELGYLGLRAYCRGNGCHPFARRRL